MVDLNGFKGARFPDVMNAADEVGISSEMFYYVMELLSGIRYASGSIYIHYKHEWELHYEQTWEDMYPEN